MKSDEKPQNSRRGGIVGKLLVAAMAGALAGGVAACENSEKATTDTPAETKQADPKAEGTAGAAKTTAGEKKEGTNSCKGPNGCGGAADKAAAGEKEGANGCKGPNGCGGAAKTAAGDKEGAHSCG
ncbi:MAG: hypothetical protein Tsb0020_23650 [Haliangiales bacterium]